MSQPAYGLHDDELSAVTDQAQRFLREAIKPEGLKALLDAAGGFDAKLWRKVVRLGWPAIAAAESAGGLGLGWRGLAALMEPLGESNGSLPLVAAAVFVRACVESRNEMLGRCFASPVAAGSKLTCLAWTQPGEAGLPALPVLCVEGGRLHGTTGLTAFAAVADCALVVASEGRRPLIAVVDLQACGVSRQVQPSIDNARAVARLSFAATPLHVVVSGAGAAAQVARLDALAALGYACEQLGGATACLNMARDHALQRVAFGQPIGRFQAIKHKLADMYTRIEVARGCISDAVDAEEVGDSTWVALAAAARLAANEAFDFAARENVQTHGGLGTTWEAMPHHYYRRARVLALELGSNAYWRERLLTEIGSPASL